MEWPGRDEPYAVEANRTAGSVQRDVVQSGYCTPDESEISVEAR